MSIWSYGGGGIWVEALTKSSLEKHVQSLQIKYSGFMNLIYSFILKVELVEVFDLLRVIEVREYSFISPYHY